MKMNELWHRIIVTLIPVGLAAMNEVYVELSGTGALSWRLIAKAAIASGVIGVANLYRWLTDPSTPTPPLPAAQAPDPRLDAAPAPDPRL